MLVEANEILTSYGYISLFITSFLASTVLPLGSEGLVALLVLKKFDMLTVVVVASIGNYLGACTSYYIGVEGRKIVIQKYLKISDDQMQMSEKMFARYGAYALLFTWLPLIGDALTVVSGALKYRFYLFTLFVFTGKFLRYFVVAYLVSFY
jgi:membrane protein YqaA with SNARE-associated domain